MPFYLLFLFPLEYLIYAPNNFLLLRIVLKRHHTIHSKTIPLKRNTMLKKLKEIKKGATVKTKWLRS